MTICRYERLVKIQGQDFGHRQAAITFWKADFLIIHTFIKNVFLVYCEMVPFYMQHTDESRGQMRGQMPLPSKKDMSGGQTGVDRIGLQ